MFFSKNKRQIPNKENALPGRSQKMAVAPSHTVFGNPLDDAFEGYEMIMVGMGCFWGAEKVYWLAEGVHSTAVGYAAGHTPNPTYEEVCSGGTAHNEVVRIVFDPEITSYENMLKIFWEGHNPTQGMRQGNDMGTQYRSGIYTYTSTQKALAEKSKKEFQAALKEARYGKITTEILPAPAFYFAEDYHQQYLAKNPDGYCGLGGTGVLLEG